MTQLEFDHEMKRLNKEMQKEYDEIDLLLLENHRQRDLVKAQISQLGG